MNKIAIITVTYNAAEYLSDFLNSLNLQENKNFKVFFVDNYSSDNTLELIKKYSKFEFEIISNQANFGVAKGNNIGIKKAMSENINWILLANNDITFDSNILLKFNEIIDIYDSEFSVFVPKIYDNSLPPRVWYSGGGFSLLKGNTGYHQKLFSKDSKVFNKHKKVAYSPTCFMLINSNVFDKVGYMDEKYFVYYDDTDFCWRLKKQNIPILYLGSISITHKIGSSTGGIDSDFTIKYSSRNRVYFLRKSIGWPTLIFFLPIFFLYYFNKYLLGSKNFYKFKLSIKGLIKGLTL